MQAVEVPFSYLSHKVSKLHVNSLVLPSTAILSQCLRWPTPTTTFQVTIGPQKNAKRGIVSSIHLYNYFYYGLHNDIFTVLDLLY